jgi:bacterial/archaeal transporter family protein
MGGGESRWLPPSLAYVVIAGMLGVTTKLALDDLSWEEVLLWTTVVYAVIALALMLGIRARLRLVRGAGWGVASGALAATALVMLFLAIGAGEVSQVVPITSSYPVITLLLAVAALGETVTAARAGATLLIVSGVVLLSLN